MVKIIMHIVNVKKKYSLIKIRSFQQIQFQKSKDMDQFKFLFVKKVIFNKQH